MTTDCATRIADPSPDGTRGIVKRGRRVRADMDDGMAPFGSLEHLHLAASWKGLLQLVRLNSRGVAGCALCRVILRANREGE